MAYKDSDELKSDERYPLGDYSFRIERSSVPGSTNDKIEAICTDKDGKNARKSIQVPSSTQMLGWYVEANGDTASVYVITKEEISDLLPSPCGYGPYMGTPVDNFPSGYVSIIGCAYTGISNGYYVYNTGEDVVCVGASDSPLSTTEVITEHSRSGDSQNTTQITGGLTYTYGGKTVYYTYQPVTNEPSFVVPISGPIYPGISNVPAKVAWTIVYGNGDDNPIEKLVARFAIELEDAGGVGPGGGIGGGWTDPGDYDPDWEEGDPTHTLYVTVTGALSGRHNDPIEDPSYSYIPADKDTVKGYGCGGDGGHGGGGGAGASTVVIHKFATNQANSKEVTAIARRHGYGSGGGKGGKGGDGCILVYY